LYHYNSERFQHSLNFLSGYNRYGVAVCQYFVEHEIAVFYHIPNPIAGAVGITLAGLMPMGSNNGIESNPPMRVKVSSKSLFFSSS